MSEMTISMDKKYRTRDGREVRLLCVDGPDASIPVIGIISGEYFARGWGASGSNLLLPELDLIEYHAPDIRTIWVNVYEGFTHEFKTEETAKFNAMSSAISIAQPVTFEVKRT